MHFTNTFLPLAFLAPALVKADAWSLTKAYAPSDIIDWTYFTDKDPTNGLVTYQNKEGAANLNLTKATDDTLTIRVDTVAERLSGRPSVRISSPDAYSDGVYVLNVSHVPTGCATWPAFWTVTSDLDNWPTGGEIDILENANDQFAWNLVSVHTKSGCTVPSTVSGQSGTVSYTNCSAYTAENNGCRVSMNGTSTPTWGAQLNAAGGGVFAMERSFGTEGKGVQVWYWETKNVPSDLSSSSQSVDTSNWGTPGARLPVQSCHEDFGTHNIIFDTTLAGDWAANTYNASGNCAATFGTVTNQIAYNGSSFNDAYWSIHSVRVFATGGGNANEANSPQASAASSLVPPFFFNALVSAAGLVAVASFVTF